MRMSQHNSHWLVLAAGLSTAIAAWLLWLFLGAPWTHKTVFQEFAAAAPKSTASAPLAAIKDPEGTKPEDVITQRGQIGDSFGGLNALLTAVAGALVLWAGYMQHQLLKKTRETSALEKEHRELQQFESLFFQLLELGAKVTDRIDGPRVKGKLKTFVPGGTNRYEWLQGAPGAKALNAYANLVFRKFGATPAREAPSIKELEALVGLFLTRVYDRQPSAFGPYFRILYQTFKHIAEAPLSEADKIRYSNIARGQISEGAVLLLALNGLTYDGHKFIPLIERFGLLEHMHRRYRKVCEPYLLLGYRSRAFMGSQERSLPSNGWTPFPLLPADVFLHLEEDRAQADLDSIFQTGFDGQEGSDE